MDHVKREYGLCKARVWIVKVEYGLGKGSGLSKARVWTIKRECVLVKGECTG